VEDKEIREQRELYKIHLESLGFKIEQDTSDQQEIIATRKNVGRYIRIYKRGIRITAVWPISEYARNNKLELLEFVNMANYVGLARYFVSDSGNFYLQMLLFCPYEGTTFGNFIDLFNSEVAGVGKLPNAEKIFRF
jgi:hypothetical protein